MKISVGNIKNLLLKAWGEFNKDQAPRLGAALAYYTVLSLAPLLILLIAIAGLVFGKEAAQGQLFGQITSMVGTEGAKAIQEMLAGASKPSSGVMASIIGFVMLVFGASSVAGELRATLNAIWDQPVDQGSGVKGMVTERSKALGVVLACGFLLVVSLVASSMIVAAGTFVSHLLPLPAVFLEGLNFIVSLAVLTGVFAVLFKYLPDANVEWHDVLIGAAFTSVLFTIGKFLIGMYLGKASFASTYGAAASLVIVLVWVYYSAQIFFFGAEFTQVYAQEFGSDPYRTRNAERDRTAAVPTQPKQQANQAGAQVSESAALKSVGALLGGALAITKVASVFRRKN